VAKINGMSWVSLCELGELSEERGKCVSVDGFNLAVFLSAGTVYVMDDECPHAGGSLGSGLVREGCAICPRHDWPFRLETGEFRRAPGVKVRTYPARLLEREGQPALVQADLPIY
jgi:nitrite reductase (NADH) small subunit